MEWLDFEHGKRMFLQRQGWTPVMEAIMTKLLETGKEPCLLHIEKELGG
jgi:hypothetical protein